MSQLFLYKNPVPSYTRAHEHTQVILKIKIWRTKFTIIQIYVPPVHLENTRKYPPSWFNVRLRVYFNVTILRFKADDIYRIVCIHVRITEPHITTLDRLFHRFPRRRSQRARTAFDSSDFWKKKTQKTVLHYRVARRSRTYRSFSLSCICKQLENACLWIKIFGI